MFINRLAFCFMLIYISARHFEQLFTLQVQLLMMIALNQL